MVTNRPEAAHRQDDATLVARAATGDPLAWDDLVRRHIRLLYAICHRHRLSEADAADVVQTVWLRLLEHLNDIRQPERLGGWLATTASRECLRLLARRRTTTPVGLPSDEDALFANPRSSDGLDVAVTAGDEAGNVLRSLTDRQRQVASRLAVGFTPSEIAEELKISAATTRSLLRHARNSVERGRVGGSIDLDAG